MSMITQMLDAGGSMNNKRIKRAIYRCRHLLPTGKFYYNIYQETSGVFFSDPETVNSETIEELKAAINRQKNISMKGQEHFARMKECQENLAKVQGRKND